MGSVNRLVTGLLALVTPSVVGLHVGTAAAVLLFASLSGCTAETTVEQPVRIRVGDRPRVAADAGLAQAINCRELLIGAGAEPVYTDAPLTEAEAEAIPVGTWGEKRDDIVVALPAELAGHVKHDCNPVLWLEAKLPSTCPSRVRVIGDWRRVAADPSGDWRLVAAAPASVRTLPLAANDWPTALGHSVEATQTVAAGVCRLAICGAGGSLPGITGDRGNIVGDANMI